MTFSSAYPLPNLPQSNHKRVVILGGGFAGLQLAKKLSGKPYQVVLLDKNNYHQFQPLFYQVATSALEPSAISFPLRKIFHHSKNVTFRMTEVESISPDEKRVFTKMGFVDFDYLVLAMGADTNYFGIENIKQKSTPMKSVSEALYIRNRIIANYEKAINTQDENEKRALMNIVIVGGGPTGVELAGAMAELRNRILPKDYPELDFHQMQVILAEAGESLLAGMTPQASAHALKYLKNLGVEVIFKAAVTDYDGLTVKVKNYPNFNSRTLVWAAGVKPNAVDGIHADQVAGNGRLLVNEFNQLAGADYIFALGDQCLMASEDYPRGHPQVAQVAIQQATNLAKNLVSLHKNQPLRPFKYKDLGSMATVGKKLAVVDLPFIRFQGFFAWVTWLFVHLMAILGVRNKLFILLNWAWNYFSFDVSLRLLIRPRMVKDHESKELVEDKD
ncbi:NAD(P)/FAD-dependent oxidoreductase [Litoribacter ruber]|uniref:NADH:ubiquinone reductase (non-electrogenic) n=1 Tax=Litoribacter ruber TaxID=702568 RepID=A0AAP2G3C5_9BACT|nr:MULTISPECIES: NAD(P)/FAD-dependent oxidoreductase [Litoribacter]MBS9523340.1 NAD(P)/FAD-dependent oxidoreductase [Litoribacter alkaliphilus]MBT0812534.1 NAD(P)/FAD-dependent oxidoreductase [Litoribacter ruber]